MSVRAWGLGWYVLPHLLGKLIMGTKCSWLISGVRFIRAIRILWVMRARLIRSIWVICVIRVIRIKGLAKLLCDLVVLNAF